MAEQTVKQTRKNSMEQGAIKELLDTDKFVNAMRKNLGLKEEHAKVCDLCEKTELKIKQVSVEDQQGNKGTKPVRYCSNCQRISKDPIKRQRWIEREHTLMDKEGIEMFITNVRGSADKIIFTSSFEEGEISKVMENFHKKISHELYESWNIYGIEKSSDAHKIVAITTNLVWAAFKRALGGETLETIGNMGDDRTLKRSESGGEKSDGLTGKLGWS